MSDFYFVGQQIIDAKTKQVHDVELLLRSKSRPGFPTEAFQKLLKSSNEEYKVYLNDLNTELRHLRETHPDYRFGLNFTQQELEFPATMTYLESLDSETRKQLIIEVTEQAPIKRLTDYSENINVNVFKRLFELGYQIAMDDIMQGNNSIGNFILVRPYLSRVKWSFVNGGEGMTQQEIYWTIKLLRSLTSKYDISLVVEGVEEEMVSYWLLTMNVHSQQGFLFAKPEEL